MKKFKFKLQGLLGLKLAGEKEVRFELTEIQALCEQQRGKITESDTKINEWSVYYNAVMKKSGNAAQLAIIDHHLQKLYRYREQLLISMDVLARKREDVMVQYNEIKREVKTIEHLRDKKREDYKVEMLREEANLSDEMASIRHSREKVLA